MSQVEDNTDYIANDILNFTGINEPPQENRQNSFVRRFDDIAKTRDIFNTQVQINDILKVLNLSLLFSDVQWQDWQVAPESRKGLHARLQGLDGPGLERVAHSQEQNRRGDTETEE